jgi:carbonic anhydrase
MRNLIDGVHRFQAAVFGPQKALFERLAVGQEPEALFITCSDSRINPNVLTQTEPGELFILRNAGNIIPPHGAPTSGEAATIEFAVAALGVKDIIVCGHTHCGAMQGLLKPETLEKLPAMAAFLRYAAATKAVLDENYAGRPPEELLEVAIAENVLVQIENLQTHPAVAARVAAGKLNLHAWVYAFERGTVFAYDRERGQYLPIDAAPGVPLPAVRAPGRGNI